MKTVYEIRHVFELDGLSVSMPFAEQFDSLTIEKEAAREQHKDDGKHYIIVEITKQTLFSFK